MRRQEKVREVEREREEKQPEWTKKAAERTTRAANVMQSKKGRSSHFISFDKKNGNTKLVADVYKKWYSTVVQ